MGEGGGCFERSKGVYKNCEGWCEGGDFFGFLSVTFLVWWSMGWGRWEGVGVGVRYIGQGVGIRWEP